MRGTLTFREAAKHGEGLSTASGTTAVTTGPVPPSTLSINSFTQGILAVVLLVRRYSSEIAEAENSNAMHAVLCVFGEGH